MISTLPAWHMFIIDLRLRGHSVEVATGTGVFCLRPRAELMGMRMVLELAIVCVFPWAMAFGGAMDLFTMTIPNRVSLSMAIGFFVLAPFLGLGLVGFLHHLAAGGAMLAIGIAMFAMGWLGGGDAKLFAAGALWVGLDHLLEFTFFITTAGGALTMALLAFRSTLPHPWIMRQAWALHLHDPKTGVPYGIAIAAAALAVYPLMPWAIAVRV